MSRLAGKIAVVTGATRGVGKGVALVLAEEGATVYVTGRTIAGAFDGKPNVLALQCDHTSDEQAEAAFARILAEAGRIDILVNNVWGGSENLIENGEFTWGLPFWRQRVQRWDSMFAAGVRAHYVASSLAAPGMVERGGGLIVNLSYWAARKYKGNVAYGVAKAATDKLAQDMAEELRPHGVTALSLYPGLVRTEMIMALAAHVDLSNSESPEFIGRTVAALAADPQVLRRSGTVVTAAELALEYGYADVDGRQPVPLTLETA